MTRLIAPVALAVSLIGVSDVLSVVKLNRSGGLEAQLGVPFDGRFTGTNVTVAALIAAAYGGTIPLDAQRLSGLPSWATRDRFDIEARVDGVEPTEDSEDDAAIFAAFAMVRALLVDRFALRVHEDSRVEAVYALVRDSRLKPAGLTLPGATATRSRRPVHSPNHSLVLTVGRCHRAGYACAAARSSRAAGRWQCWPGGSPRWQASNVRSSI